MDDLDGGTLLAMGTFDPHAIVGHAREVELGACQVGHEGTYLLLQTLSSCLREPIRGALWLRGRRQDFSVRLVMLFRTEQVWPTPMAGVAWLEGEQDLARCVHGALVTPVGMGVRSGNAAVRLAADLGAMCSAEMIFGRNTTGPLGCLRLGM